MEKNNTRFPRAIREIYEWFSEAPVEVYRRFGIKAEYREVNDIVTSEGRKIAGEGGGNIGECMVFVGGILLDFDYNAMSQIICVPEEKFRDKIFKTLRDSLTNMKRELGVLPPREEVVSVLKEEYEKKVGRLSSGFLNAEIVYKMHQLERWMTSPEFLHKRTPHFVMSETNGRQNDILTGIYKTRGGLIRTTGKISSDAIELVAISGDFTLFPKEGISSLEAALKGVKLERKKIADVAEQFYEENNIESPGITPEDFAKTISGQHF